MISIGYDAFEGCSGLTSLTIPNSVTNIDNAAFKDCSGLTSLTIGNSVTSIGKGAFEGDERISDIYVKNPTPPIISEPLEQGSIIDSDFVSEVVFQNAIVHIPAGTLDLYSSASGWRKFRNFKEDVNDAQN